MLLLVQMEVHDRGFYMPMNGVQNRTTKLCKLHDLTCISYLTMITKFSFYKILVVWCYRLITYSKLLTEMFYPHSWTMWNVKVLGTYWISNGWAIKKRMLHPSWTITKYSRGVSSKQVLNPTYGVSFEPLISRSYSIYIEGLKSSWAKML